MPKVTFISHDGAARTIDVPLGLSVMEGAIKNSVDGIDADCGGACACATCHVYVEPEWAAKMPPKSDMEGDMISFAFDTTEYSRLSCQIKMTDELDGLVVKTPASQH